jgi:hypothetical protein
MPALTESVRVPKMAPPDSDDDPYVELVKAIIARAVQDARGHVVHLGNRAPGQIEVEARPWLQDGCALAALLELAGFESEPVVRRVRQMFPPDTERSRA